MAREIVMPKLGLTMSEGTIVRWNKAEGDEVKVGDVLMSVETDKLTNDVVSDADGILRLILVKEGETVPVKELVAVVAAAGEDISAFEARAPKAKEPAKDEKAEEVKASSPKEERTTKAAGDNLASPYAKKLASDWGIDLSNVTPSGYDGVIVSRDVESAKYNLPKMSGAARNAAAVHGIDVSKISKDSRVLKADVMARLNASQTPSSEREAASNMRKIIAKNMLNNWTTSPMVTFDIDVEMDSIIELRKQVNSHNSEDGVKVSYNHIIMKILSKLLLKHRALNSYFDGEEIEYHDYVNIGLAVATDTGLIVPNLKNAHLMSLNEIAILTEDLVARTRTDSIDLDEMQGGTFTISNLGMYGLRSFTPIINKPEVAIMGINTIRDELRLACCSGEDKAGANVKTVKVTTFSLTCDHSMVDGAAAAAFLSEFKQLAEHPYLLI